MLGALFEQVRGQIAGRDREAAVTAGVDQVDHLVVSLAPVDAQPDRLWPREDFIPRALGELFGHELGDLKAFGQMVDTGIEQPVGAGGKILVGVGLQVRCGGLLHGAAVVVGAVHCMHST